MSKNTSDQINFIQKIIDNDNASGKWDTRVHTRFPPEPNGYLHIGHAKSICLNFGLAEKNNGKCNLRFDDTNPVKEEEEFVQSIIEDVKWLGFDWEDRLFYASDYFNQMYEYAVQLIRNGSAFVCDQTAEEIKECRGTLTESGEESPYRNRSVDENLDLFQRMKDGEFDNGVKTLRARIDMSHSNLNMRDPVIYRILHASIIEPAIPGASIPCTIGPTVWKTLLRELPIPSALWSLRTTDRSMTGIWISWVFITRSRSSLHD